MNPTEIAEDAEIVKMLEAVTYFNIEVSEDIYIHQHTSLVFNASRLGIDAFLQIYGHLTVPPDEISLNGLQRPERTWLSPSVLENEEAVPSDPTPYKVRTNSYVKNILLDTLKVDFFKDDETIPILCAGIRDNTPLMTVNQKGWLQFLKLLRQLRDKSYWFFVTQVNPSWKHLPFQLTTPYRGEENDHVFRALEFIRLEPVKEIFVDTGGSGDLCANNTGFLLWSHWMRSFAKSPEMEKEIINRWNGLPESLTEDNYVIPPPIKLYLHKSRLDSPYPIFSLEGETYDSKDLHIFGNCKGFEELGEILEEFAFYSDHDSFSKSTPERRLKGDVIDGNLGPPGLHQSVLGLVGGGKFTPRYNPLSFGGTKANPDLRSEFETEKTFVNERLVLTDDN